ncbi:4-coumarate--CoA ligase 1-like [Vespula maculifrons]|uniref:4-coumarate--CoA ligase 1-like n=1 Tax=Vespula maculifrons TaxID=7453 RepID=A0ABD2CRH2_VESMC
MWSLYAFPILWTVLYPFFAIFCEAAIFTPWNSTMDIREARYFMKLSGAKIVFADENSVNTILKVVKLDNNDIKIVVFGRARNECFTFSNILKGHIKFDVDNFQCTSVDSIHDIAELLYSSAMNFYRTISIQKESYSGYYHTFGCWSFINVEFYCELLQQTALSYIRRGDDVTWMFLSRSMANRILKSGYCKKYDVSSISKLNLSEMTEFCNIITAQKSHHKADSVGTVGKNAQIKIVDLKTRYALGPNKIDELLRK